MSDTLPPSGWIPQACLGRECSATQRAAAYCVIQCSAGASNSQGNALGAVLGEYLGASQDSPPTQKTPIWWNLKCSFKGLLTHTRPTEYPYVTSLKPCILPSAFGPTQKIMSRLEANQSPSLPHVRTHLDVLQPGSAWRR